MSTHVRTLLHNFRNYRRREITSQKRTHKERHESGLAHLTIGYRNMLPYSRGLILDNANNYGIVKTEAVFGFGQRNSNNFRINNTEPLEWLISPVNLERRSILEKRSLQESSRAVNPTEVTQKDVNRHGKKAEKKAGKKRKGKGKKCIYKVINKNKRQRRKKHGNKMNKKFLFPLIIGLLAAKSVLIPIALKALAFMSAKGFLMGFFSTILASFLSIKGMFDHNYRYQDRKDEKTQVEIIQVPNHAKEEHFYDDHYRKSEFIPLIN